MTHDAETVELKPCPFCGGRASMRRDHCLDGGGIFAFIECHGCRGRSPQKYYSHGNDCPQTYAEIRDAWNTRATLPPQEVTGLLDPDMPDDQMRLHAGEMTAQEILTARAFIRLANARALSAMSVEDAAKVLLDEYDRAFPDSVLTAALRAISEGE